MAVQDSNMVEMQGKKGKKNKSSSHDPSQELGHMDGLVVLEGRMAFVEAEGR